MAISVWPQRGRTYPDALGNPITSVGAIVDESRYILDSVDAGYLLTYDPLNIYSPDDRTGLTANAPSDAGFLTVGGEMGLTNERVITAGTGITFDDTGPNGTLTINATGSGDVVGPASSTDNRIARFDGATGKLIQDALATLDDSGNLTVIGSIAGAVGVRTVSTPTDTFVNGDANAVVRVTVTSTITIPTDAALNFRPGTEIIVVAVGGVTITLGTTGISLQGASVCGGISGATIRLRKYGTNAWMSDSGVQMFGAATNNRIPKFAGATAISSSGVNIDSSNNVTGVVDFTCTGNITVSGTVDGVDVGNLAAVPFVTIGNTATVANERALTAGAGITITDGGAGGAVTVATLTTINTQATTTYTLVLTDAEKLVDLVSVSPITLTVPTAATVAFPVGTTIQVLQNTTGAVTVVGAGGVTILTPTGYNAKTASPRAIVVLTKLSTNTWALNGELEATTSYVTLGTASNLANERVLTAGAGITITDGGAGGAVTVATSNGPARHVLIASAPGTQVVASGGAGDVVQWTESSDPGNNFASNAYTAPFTGFYEINAYTFIPAGTGSGLLRVRVGGGTLFTFSSVPLAGGGGAGLVNAPSVIVPATAGQAIDFTIIQNTGANQTVGPTSYLMIRPLSA